MALFPTLSSVPYTTPLSSSIEWKTLITQYGDGGTEQRKQKHLYPRRSYSLIYKYLSLADARIVWQFYNNRKGSLEAFNFFLPYSDVYESEYVGIGDGFTTIFNLPAKMSSSYTLYTNGVTQEAGTDYTFTATGGTDGADQVTYAVAPVSGAVITFDFTGYLKIRSRFAKDNLDIDMIYGYLSSTGLELKGLLNA